MKPQDHSIAAMVVYEEVRDYLRYYKEFISETEHFSIEIAKALMKAGCINRAGAAKWRSTNENSDRKRD